MAIHYAVYDTLINDVTLLANERSLIGMLFGANDPLGAENEENLCLYDAICQLNQYFFGQLKQFHVRLFYTGSDFDMKVYNYVCTIPYGHTKTFEEVAQAIGEPNAAKAVANALSHNPIPIFIPDHRVIGKGGNLVTYCGPLELKKALLELESKHSEDIFIPKGQN